MNQRHHISLAVLALAGAFSSSGCKPEGGTPSSVASSTTSSAPVAAQAPSASAAARAAVRRLQREALAEVSNHEWEKGKEKLVEAQALAPDDEEVTKAIAVVDERLSKKVAGRWFSRVEKDAMTDKENVYMTLAASADIGQGLLKSRPILVARCMKGEIDLSIEIKAVVEGDIHGGSKAQYRFDAEAPQAITMTRATDLKGVFFREAPKWLDRMVEHTAGKLVVEIPLFGRTPEAATFDLGGADKAIPLVKRACGK